MGLLEKIFPRYSKAQEVNTYFKTFSAYNPAFQTYEGGIYEMELTRACVHAFATHASKLSATAKGSEAQKLQHLFKVRPNPYTSLSRFLYRTATILSVQNTVFIVPSLDPFGRITGYYPVLPSRCEVIEYKSELWLRYKFANGQKAAIEYSKVGVLTDFQYKNEFFGESNAALQPTMELINDQNQGISLGIKNRAGHRFFAVASNLTKQTDLSKDSKKFTEGNFGADNDSAVLLFPNTYTNIQQIRAENLNVGAEQMRAIETRVFDYFGSNEDVLQNKCVGDKWSGYYEGKIEPFAIQLSEAMTNMTFSGRAQAAGNQIFFSANRLQYMSNADKLAYSREMFDRGLASRNDVFEIWNLPPVEGGDKYYIRKEYIEVSKLGGVDNGAQE